HIPAVYFGALLSAACVVEIPALAAGLKASMDEAVWSTGGPPRPCLRWPWARVVGLLGLGLLSAHAMIRWLDPSPHVPDQQDRVKAGRLLDYFVQQGPQVFLPFHPFT